ncbi:hypothetical protein QIA27_05540 (plasmid) [Borreliella tanukii]|uniref:hypothetical protein n=1 Tax=Borreliella tanukii TaxID=56146 RepID=UPI003AF1607A
MNRVVVDNSARISKFANTVLSALQIEPDNSASEIMNPYFAESVSEVVFLTLAPLLDYRIEEAVFQLVRTDHFSKTLSINSYSTMIKQWAALSYWDYIALHPDEDVRQPGKLAMPPQSMANGLLNIVKY